MYTMSRKRFTVAQFVPWMFYVDHLGTKEENLPVFLRQCVVMY
jgi:hypothetical protein